MSLHTVLLSHLLGNKLYMCSLFVSWSEKSSCSCWSGNNCLHVEVTRDRCYGIGDKPLSWLYLVLDAIQVKELMVKVIGKIMKTPPMQIYFWSEIPWLSSSIFNIFLSGITEKSLEEVVCKWNYFSWGCHSSCLSSEKWTINFQNAYMKCLQLAHAVSCLYFCLLTFLEQLLGWIRYLMLISLCSFSQVS